MAPPKAPFPGTSEFAMPVHPGQSFTQFITNPNMNQHMHPEQNLQIYFPQHAAAMQFPGLAPQPDEPELSQEEIDTRAVTEVLDKMRENGFSLRLFLTTVFKSSNSNIKRRTAMFYNDKGHIELMDIFAASRKAQENGFDQALAAHVERVYNAEFQALAHVNQDPRSTTKSKRGKLSPADTLKKSLETMDPIDVQKEVEKSAPKLFSLMRSFVIGEKGAELESQRIVPEEPSNGAQVPQRAKRRLALNPKDASNQPALMLVFLILIAASSQVKNRFQKYLGLYLYSTGLQKNPMNVLRVMGVCAESKVVCDNLLRSLAEDMRIRVRQEMGSTQLRRTEAIQEAPEPSTGANPRKRKRGANLKKAQKSLEGLSDDRVKEQFLITYATYEKTSRDRADAFSTCGTVPGILKLPKDIPRLTQAMAKSDEQRKRLLYDISTGPGAGDIVGRKLGLSELGRTHLEQVGKAWIARAMKRLWPAELDEYGLAVEDIPIVQHLYHESAVVGEEEAEERDGESTPDIVEKRYMGITSDDLTILPNVKKVGSSEANLVKLLDSVRSYMGLEKEDVTHWRGVDFDDDDELPSDIPERSPRLILIASGLDGVRALRTAKAKGQSKDDAYSKLDWAFPVLQVFDIKRDFLHQLMKFHYGKSTQSDAGSLCHHTFALARRFVIMGFGVVGPYAEGLLRHTLEAHLIDAIMSVTTLRKEGPQTAEEASELIETVFSRFLLPDMVALRQNSPDNRDEVYENNMLFMQHAIVYQELSEAIAKGDIGRLQFALEWLAVAYQSFPGSPMGKELMNLVAGLKYEWDHDLQEAVLRTMLMKKPVDFKDESFPLILAHAASAPVKGDFQETDFTMKQMLRLSKNIFDARGNPKYDFFSNNVTPNVRLISKLVRNTEDMFRAVARGASVWKSPAEEVNPNTDIPKLVQELRKNRISEFLPGRKASVPAVNFAYAGNEAIRSDTFVEGFLKGANSRPAEKKKKQQQQQQDQKGPNLFWNEEFSFDWGI